MSLRASERDRVGSDGRLCRSFWFVFVLNHLLFAAVLCSPCDVYGVSLGVAILVYFSNRTCSPPDGHTAPTQTQGNLNVLGYYIGAVVIYRNIPAAFGSPRTLCLVGLVALDCVMGFGHTWDREMSMETVTNCRLFYVCALSLSVCVLYGFWYDTLRIP